MALNTGEYPLLMNAEHKILGSEYCSGYSDIFGQWNTGFYCPQSESTTAVSCCGTPTFKYCCTLNQTSSTTAFPSSSTEVEPSKEVEDIPFLVRSPVISGVIMGFLLVTVFIAIGSCYFYSCCLFSKKLQHPSSSASLPGFCRTQSSTGSISSSSLNQNSRRGSVIQSVIVCTTELSPPSAKEGHFQIERRQRQLPFIPSNNHQQHELKPFVVQKPNSLKSNILPAIAYSNPILPQNLNLPNHFYTNQPTYSTKLQSTAAITNQSSQSHIPYINHVPNHRDNNELHPKLITCNNIIVQPSPSSSSPFPVLQIPCYASTPSGHATGNPSSSGESVNTRNVRSIPRYNKPPGPELLLYCPTQTSISPTPLWSNDKGDGRSYSSATLPLCRHQSLVNFDNASRSRMMNYSFSNDYQSDFYRSSKCNELNNTSHSRPYYTLNYRPHSSQSGILKTHKGILKNSTSYATTNYHLFPDSYETKDFSRASSATDAQLSQKFSHVSTQQPDLIQTRYAASSNNSRSRSATPQEYQTFSPSGRSSPWNVKFKSESETNAREMVNRLPFNGRDVIEYESSDIVVEGKRGAILVRQNETGESFESGESDQQEKDTFL